jgi:DNA polymerase I
VVRGNAERNAINAPIQGSAADIIKVAMIRIHDRLKAELPSARMVLQVHDELMFEVKPDEVEMLKGIVIPEMEGAVKLKVKMLTDSGTGNNWLAAH